MFNFYALAPLFIAACYNESPPSKEQFLKAFKDNGHYWTHGATKRDQVDERCLRHTKDGDYVKRNFNLTRRAQINSKTGTTITFRETTWKARYRQSRNGNKPSLLLFNSQGQVFRSYFFQHWDEKEKCFVFTYTDRSNSEGSTECDLNVWGALPEDKGKYPSCEAALNRSCNWGAKVWDYKANCVEENSS